jgi:hypothetical protein
MLLRRKKRKKSSLATLPDGDEVGELVKSEAFPSISPLVKYENDIVESEALFRHVQEPHAHGRRPHHETNKLETIVNI